MKTNKIYLADMYKTEITAKVIDINNNQIILDHTILFAEAGGQISDTGFINNIKVIDSHHQFTSETIILSEPDFPIINVNTAIAHKVGEDINTFKVGEEVSVRLDWERRKQIMRTHSACHIVLIFAFQIIPEKYLKGCFIQPKKGRLDFSVKINNEDLCTIEKQSNEFINKSSKNIHCVPSEYHPEALYWICDHYKIPCGGTHVRNTSEIGIINLKRRSQGKNLDRIYIHLT